MTTTRFTHSYRTVVLNSSDGTVEIFNIKHVADFIPNDMLIDMIIGPPPNQTGKAI